MMNTVEDRLLGGTNTLADQCWGRSILRRLNTGEDQYRGGSTLLCLMLLGTGQDPLLGRMNYWGESILRRINTQEDQLLGRINYYGGSILRRINYWSSNGF